MTWLEFISIIVIGFFTYLSIISYCEMKKTQAIEETKRVTEKPVSTIFGLPMENHPKSPN